MDPPLKLLPYNYRIPENKPGVWIQLMRPSDPPAPYPDHGTLTESEADAIMKWTMEHKIGVRMSFDMWRFRSEADRTAFILKWCC